MSKISTETSEERERAIEISFGAIHTHKQDKRLRYVILDVGEDDWFITSQIVENGRIGSPGTSYLSDIDEVIDHMDLNDILKGITQSIGSLSPHMKAELVEYSQKPPRVLTK